jgi:hypothetical protein
MVVLKMRTHVLVLLSAFSAVNSSLGASRVLLGDDDDLGSNYVDIGPNLAAVGASVFSDSGVSDALCQAYSYNFWFSCVSPAFVLPETSFKVTCVACCIESAY